MSNATRNVRAHSRLAIPSGIKGDNGTTNNTAAIQAALDTGYDVYIPGASGYYKITDDLVMASDNQRIFGDGDGTVIRQTTTLKNCIRAVGKTGVKIERLKLHAVGDKSSLSDGCGVFLSGCARAEVSHVTVTNHLGAGVNLVGTDNSIVEHCTFESSPAADDALNNAVGADIQVIYASAGNKIRFNRCVSGNGVGIYIQSVTVGDNNDDNEVVCNYVQDAKAYGIMTYRNQDAYPAADSVRRTLIALNTVVNTTGTIVSATTGTYVYGAAIYVQGAEDTIVSHNIIKSSHSGGKTYAETLAPGAIGTTNQRRVVIVGNQIDTCGMFGIYCGDGNTIGEPIGFAVVEANTITNCTRGGIDVVRRGYINVLGNTIGTTADSGIEVNNASTAVPGIAIRGNTVRNVTGTSGIEVKYATRPDITGNTVDTASTHGISVENCTDARIVGNRVKDHTSSGIYVTSSASGTVLLDNGVDGTGSSSIGIRLEAATFRDDSNTTTNSTSLWSGAFAPYYTLTVNSTTPSVLHAREVKTVNTNPTTITNFTDGVQGQSITVVIGDANTTLDFTSSNLKGNGGVDRAMASGDVVQATFRADGLNVWYCTIIDV